MNVETDNLSQPSVQAIKPLVDFSAPSIDAWVSHLPLSDVEAACEAIHALLRRVNMTDGLDCLERQRIVEQIRPPAVSLLAMSSEKHLPASTVFPLSATKFKNTQRSVEICLELANAYRRVVTGGNFFSDKTGSDFGRAQIVYRALQAYGLALLRSLERYASPPEGFWQEVFSFYAFAEGHRLNNLALPAPEIEGATIDSQFKQIVLLALSSHQHHVPDEIRQFYTALMLIAKDAEIGIEPVRGEESALYYFDLGLDNDPRPMKRAKPLNVGARRYLFIANMLRLARQYFATPSHRATDRYKLRIDVILSLLDALAATEKRRFVRTSASGKRRFVVGLPRLIAELSAEPPQLLAEASRVLDEGEPPPQEDDDMDEVEIILDHAGGAGGNVIWATGKSASGKPGADIDAGTAEDDAANGEFVGGLLNQSAGGYCLEWLNQQATGARVGELIGLYEDDQRIHLGVIRWLHHKTRFGLVIGVQLLSPVVEAVEVETGAEADNLLRGLYLFANGRLGQPASLLCGPGVFKHEQNIVLRSKAGERLHFRLEKLLNTTLSFQLFSLTKPPEMAIQKTGKTVQTLGA